MTRGQEICASDTAGPGWHQLLMLQERVREGVGRTFSAYLLLLCRVSNRMAYALEIPAWGWRWPGVVILKVVSLWWNYWSKTTIFTGMVIYGQVIVLILIPCFVSPNFAGLWQGVKMGHLPAEGNSPGGWEYWCFYSISAWGAWWWWGESAGVDAPALSLQIPLFRKQGSSRNLVSLKLQLSKLHFF